MMKNHFFIWGIKWKNKLFSFEKKVINGRGGDVFLIIPSFFSVFLRMRGVIKLRHFLWLLWIMGLLVFNFEWLMLQLPLLNLEHSVDKSYIFLSLITIVIMASLLFKSIFRSFFAVIYTSPQSFIITFSHSWV